MKTLILLLSVASITVHATAIYPIEPRPLRKLIEESDYIIIGHVTEITSTKRKSNGGDAHVAHVSIREVLKGSIDRAVIEIPFNPYYICPAPPHYEANTDVIVFLNKEKNVFYTHALSYGVKTLSLAEIEIYKQRIIEMQKISGIADEDKKFMETVEWLVKCAEQDATRWEGTFELSPSSDFMSYYSRSALPPFKYLLSTGQKDRLKKALLSSEEFGYSNFGLVDLVYIGNEHEIHQYLMRGLKSLGKGHQWLAGEFMVRLMYQKQSAELEALHQQFTAVQFEYDKADEIMNIVSKFIALAEQ